MWLAPQLRLYQKMLELPVIVLSDVDVTIAGDAEVVVKMLDDEALMEGRVEDSKLWVVSFLSDANKGFF